MEKFTLKPFFCVSFPLTIDEHVLTIDEPEFTSRPQCCSIVPEGSLTVLDVCREELEYMLGAEGVEELEDIFVEDVVSPVESAV